MSLTDVMDDVDYERVNFNENEALSQHPLWLTQSHFVYNLDRGADGVLAFQRDGEGEPLCSPRLLKEMVMQKVVVKPSRMKKLMGYEVPADLYPSLLTEAIFQRSLQTVAHLVATWPNPDLDVYSVLPTEEMSSCQQLSTPFDNAHPAGMSLLDAFMVGLLNLKPHAKLRSINFSGFKHDRKLCRELVRLPLLWMKPSERQPGYIHSLLRHCLGVTKDKVERYINHINNIYGTIDLQVKHGHLIGPVTVTLDCKVTLDDVPIGLVLQYQTPFRFKGQRVWLEPISDIDVPLTTISQLLDPACITHLEIAQPAACGDSQKWTALLETIRALPALRSLSLPNTLHVDRQPDALPELADTLAGDSLPALRRLNLSSCNLRDNLHHLLQRLGAGEAPGKGVTYLSLRDCRLAKADVEALLEWPGVSDLRELNLSNNNLQTVVPPVVELLDKMADSAVCFSVSFCSLSLVGMQQVVRKCKECRHLKILAIQSFTPPPVDEMRGILEDCADIVTLQRCILLPEAYAFPGGQISQRTANREEVGRMCTDILIELGRTDVTIE